MRSSARTAPPAVSSQTTSSIRVETAKEIQEILENQLTISNVTVVPEIVENTVREIEEAIYINTIRIMVQASDAPFIKIYRSFFSNLKFNLTSQSNSDDPLIKRILSNPTATLNAIITSGPLELNRDIPEIQDLHRQEEKDLERGIGLTANAVNVMCATCKGTSMHNFERQTRSSDEPPTQYYICLNPECKMYGQERRYAIKLKERTLS